MAVLLPRGHVAGVIGILAITIIAGAFVAGMNAGLIYNEYPLMGGQFIPIEYGFYGADAFENPASAQFHHRWLAALAALGVVSLWFRAKKHGLTVRLYDAGGGGLPVCAWRFDIYYIKSRSA
jgi:cytochrome c oxidase assembly protein subunit 15